MTLRTPEGKVVEIDDHSLDAVVLIVEGARARAFDEVLLLLDHDYNRMKDCGDLVTAELFDMMRAKVRAKKEK